MNNKVQVILCMIIISFSSLSQAQLVTTYSVNSPIMKEISEWVDKETIVFIDLDDTLMTPKSLMISHNSNPYRLFIDNMITLGKRVTHYNVSVAKWYQQRQVKLVEDAWPEYIQKLRSKGAAVYGVCTMPLHLVNIEEKRYLEATGLKIIFTNKINDKELLEIEKTAPWFSFFYKGIIFTGQYSKSHTLMEFLRATEVPKKLVFITNIKHELERVEEHLRVFDMDYYNVLYLGVKEISGRPEEKLVKFQQQGLIQSGIWLEDDVAKAALDRQEQAAMPVQ
jgi:hypothetical protein